MSFTHSGKAEATCRTSPPKRRKICVAGIIFATTVACKSRPMTIQLNLSLFNYMSRPIYDVCLNGVGLMAALEHAFHGENAVMLMQPITIGPQKITWKYGGPEGAPDLGRLISARNIVSIDSVKGNIKWLGLHLYDDETAEIALSNGRVEDLQTKRGRQIIERWEKSRV